MRKAISNPKHSGVASPAVMQRARILLVDDDERNLLALSEVLEPIADVVTAPSGREALRELLKDDFAVILLDVFMPEMDGYETASLIRQRPQTARIPIIFLSAVNKETEHLMRGYAMGAVDYVFKPVDPIVLKSKVAVFVDLFQLRQQIATRAEAERELEQQLVQSRKTEALGQLTGGVAHDFNNLLAAVLGGLRLIEGRVELGHREQRIFDHMRHAAENGVELVRRLMAFARKQELTPVAIEPAKLCDTVSGLVDHAMGVAVSVEWDVRPEGLRLFADEAQLELALVNLLINARDAMGDGGAVKVTIEGVERPDDLKEQKDAPHWLRICVTDQGSGIPPELIERVTEPFFTTKGPGKGTGLGLSMVAGFVQQSGGLFRIASEPGRGTQVEMTFPATRAEAQGQTATSRSDAGDTLVGSVLVVDDDEGVRTVVSEQLRDLGLDVSEAENAERALALLQDGASAEFLLTDFSMPGMDGLSLIMAVRGRWPQIRGAIMTGNPKGKLVSCDPQIPVIHKPIDLGELKRLLVAA